MFTDQRARQVVRRRGFRESERRILDLALAKRWMIHWKVHLAVAQLRVMFHPVFGALHRKCANSGSLTALGQLVLAQRHAPRFDLLVQFLLVLQASEDTGEFRRGSPRRSAH